MDMLTYYGHIKKRKLNLGFLDDFWPHCVWPDCALVIATSAIISQCYHISH